MERALYISRPDELGFWKKRYSRIYFGNEFCERLYPSEEDLEKVLKFICKKKIDFSLMTGIISEEKIERIESLLKILSAKKPDSEVVINDWGLLKMGQRYRLKIILGRLLIKQQRDPRILGLIRNLPDRLSEGYKKGCLNSFFIKFLNDNNIDRIEVDNLLQGLSLDELDSNKMSCSIYFPYLYIATSRFCFLRSFTGGSENNSLSIGCCDKECNKFSFILRNPNMPIPLILKGNTIFFKNKNLRIGITNNKIDRIVFEPNIPI